MALADFRSYESLDIRLEPGTTVFVGPNGMGKTNIAEAIGYLGSLSSHRVSGDGPLIRFGADRAVVSARVIRARQAATVELEINGGRANRARINRAAPVPAREILGLCRTVLFSPEDLGLVKGEPAGRRRFIDDLAVMLVPRHGRTRSDYERVLKQRNALLKSARGSGRMQATGETTLDVWDHHLATAGALLLKARLETLHRLRPHLSEAYGSISDGPRQITANYRSDLVHGSAEDDQGGGQPDPDAAELYGMSAEELTDRYLAALGRNRRRELERGVSLTGPHRDDITLVLGSAPAKGYASHGETWSVGLALRLGTYRLMCDDDRTPGATPILILDDVFAELDENRRTRLAATVADAEQLLITAAVGADIPPSVDGRRIRVFPGGVEAQDE